MCVYSMVYDHYKTKYPNPYEWKRITYEEYDELVRKAREYDRIHNKRDCVKPDAEEFERILKDRFAGVIGIGTESARVSSAENVPNIRI